VSIAVDIAPLNSVIEEIESKRLNRTTVPFLELGKTRVSALVFSKFTKRHRILKQRHALLRWALSAVFELIAVLLVITPLNMSTQRSGTTEHNGTQRPMLIERQRLSVSVEER